MFISKTFALLLAHKLLAVEVLLAGARVQLMPAHSCISVTFALPKMELTNRWGKGNNVSQQTLDTCVPQSDGSTVQFMHGEIGESKE